MDYDDKYIYTYECTPKTYRPITLLRVNITGHIISRPVHFEQVDANLTKPFTHTGVVLGTDVTNVNFPANLFICDKQQQCLRIVSFEEFRDGDTVSILKPIRTTCPDRVLARLKKYISEGKDQYDLLLNNCQSFTNEIVYGYNIPNCNAFLLYIVILFLSLFLLNMNRK